MSTMDRHDYIPAHIEKCEGSVLRFFGYSETKEELVQKLKQAIKNSKIPICKAVDSKNFSELKSLVRIDVIFRWEDYGKDEDELIDRFVSMFDGEKKIPEIGSIFSESITRPAFCAIAFVNYNSSAQEE